jgi:glycosyltransferase involved in cell wall biosynthesis
VRTEISFTAIIPYFKNKNTILKSLQSIFKQTYPAQEIIVIDDGSGDHELEALIGNLGIKLIQLNANMGSAFARSYGSELALTSHVALLDADDYWYPNHLQTHATFWEKCDDRVGAISTIMKVVTNLEWHNEHFEPQIRGQKKLIFPSNLSVAFSNPFWNSATTIRKETLKELNFWSCESPSYAEDYDLVVRMLRSGKQIGLSATTTGLYLDHKDSKSNSVEKVSDSRTVSAIALLTASREPYFLRRLRETIVLNYIWFSTLIFLARRRMSYVPMKNPNTIKLISYRILNPMFKNPINWRILAYLLRIISNLHIRRFIIFRKSANRGSLT